MGKSTDFEVSSSQYIAYTNASAGPHVSITDYPFSVCAWVNIESVSGVREIINMSDWADGGVYHGIDCFGSNFRAKSRDGVSQATATGSTTLQTGRWYFVCGVFASDTSRKIYVNSVEDGSNSTSKNFVSGMDSSNVGALLDNGTAFTPMDGKVAHAQIYNTDLSTAQMQAIMNDPTKGPSANLLWWLPLNDGSDLGLDLSGNGWDGTLFNTPVVSTNGPPFKSYSGARITTDGLKRSGATGPYTQVTDYPVTLATWVRFYSLTSAEQGILWFGLGSSAQTYLELSYFGSASAAPNNNFVALDRMNVAGTTARASGTSASASTWYHLVGVFNNNSSRLLYVNGALVDTNTTTTGAFSTLNKVTIGRTDDSSPQTTSQIQFAYSQVFDKALSAGEVKELYENPYGASDAVAWLIPGNVSPTAVSDLKDSSGFDYDCDAGAIPNQWTDGPNIHYFAGVL